MSKSVSRHDWRGATDNEINATIRTCPVDTEFDKGVRAALLWVMDAVGNRHPLDMERRLDVHLETNHATFLGDMISLGNVEAEVLHCIARSYPALATHESIRSGVWGVASNAPHSYRTVISNTVLILRDLLRPWHFGIKVVRGKGYCLVYPPPPKVGK